ncbi:MAG: hypothetical protein IJR37_01950, partial [Schwartzia sp.]|nr:hypothetical protein [Schwartzia sp. (in: firmicutes)]
MKRKCREGNRRERELTRLILTALILGSGCLYGPVAEAATLIEVTDSPYYINTPYAGQLKQEVNKVVHAVTPDVAWTLNSTNSGWNTFSISGGYIT